jgi:peptidoglycan/LPS O-acetylase OafA/YrhL
MGCFRLWLALCVVFFHIVPRVTGTLDGRLAVESFYLVSGFFMAMILDTRYRGLTRAFYINRFLRIYPLYWLVLFLTLASLFWIYKAGALGGSLLIWFKFIPHFQFTSVFLLVFSQLFLIGLPWLILGEFRAPNGAFHFSIAPFAQPLPAYPFFFIGPAWSLGVEDFFYLFAPWIVTLSDTTLICLATLAGSIKGLAGLLYGLNYEPWSYMFTGFEIFFFVGGVLSYRLYKKLKSNRQIEWWGWKAFSGLLCVVILGLPFAPMIDSFIWFPLAVLMMLGLPWIFELGNRHPWDRSLGNLSYPLYLSHQPLLTFLSSPIFENFPKLALHYSLVPLCLLLAAMLHLGIERPVNRLRQSLLKSAAKKDGNLQGPPSLEHA